MFHVFFFSPLCILQMTAQMQRILTSVPTSLSSPTLPAYGNEQSSRQTQTHSRFLIHIQPAMELKRHKLKQAQDTIFIWSLTHIYSQTCTYTRTSKSEKKRIIEYGTNTQALNDSPHQVCVDRLCSFVSLYPLRVAFRLSGRTLAALHIQALTF